MSDQVLEKPVFVTKYGLTVGILKLTKGEWHKTDDGSRIYFCAEQGGYNLFVNPEDWTTDLQVAEARIADMVARKMKSLKKQLVILETYVPPLKEVV